MFVKNFKQKYLQFNNIKEWFYEEFKIMKSVVGKNNNLLSDERYTVKKIKYIWFGIEKNTENNDAFWM